MTPPLLSRSVQTLLDALYADAVRVDPEVRKRAAGIEEHGAGFYAAMREAYMPVTPDFGRMLYLLVACKRPALIVEFGASFGISTLFMAAALRESGSGHLISTELESSKAARARENLRAVGLDSVVEIRVGDARDTLRDLAPDCIDILFLDGEKSLYLSLLQMLEPALKQRGLVVSDNVDFEGAEAFVAHVTGYLRASFSTQALGTQHSHQILLRSAP